MFSESLYRPTRMGMQLEASEHFFRELKAKHRWAIQINCDEFIVMKNYTDIKTLMAVYIPGGNKGLWTLLVPWLMFGTNGRVYKEDIPVTRRFTRNKGHMSKTVKSIFGCEYIREHKSAHWPTLFTRAYEPGSKYHVTGVSFPPQMPLRPGPPATCI